MSQEVAVEYPDIESNDRIADNNVCMQLVQRPEEYRSSSYRTRNGDIVRTS